MPTPKNDAPRAIGVAHVTHQADAVLMDDYPLLTYGPAADPKVRIASSGVPIEDALDDEDSGHSEEELAEARRYVDDAAGG